MMATSEIDLSQVRSLDDQANGFRAAALSSLVWQEQSAQHCGSWEYGLWETFSV